MKWHFNYKIYKLLYRLLLTKGNHRLDIIFVCQRLPCIKYCFETLQIPN